MTVTITAADLVQPTGELSNDYFPQGDLDDQIDGWLAVAAARVEADSDIGSTRHDDAAEAYVYYRAYDYIANQLAALPNSASEGDGAISVNIAVTQFRYYQDKAAAKLVAYEGYRSASSLIGTHFTLATGRRGL